MPQLSKMKVEWNLELYFGYWILTDAELKDQRKKLLPVLGVGIVCKKENVFYCV